MSKWLGAERKGICMQGLTAILASYVVVVHAGAVCRRAALPAAVPGGAWWACGRMPAF